MSESYRGSSWRQWDLHLHTPESYERGYEGATHEEKWERYLDALRALVGVEVVGITDYWTYPDSVDR